MKRLLAALLTGGMLTAMVGGVAAADAPHTGCPHGWLDGIAESEAALARDRNADTALCFIRVPGRGNGAFLEPNVVVVDNTVADAAR